MTDNELEFVSVLLDELRHQLANRTCNDVPKKWVDHFTKAEHRQMALQYHTWNGDREEARDMIPADFCFASFFAAKIRGEIP